MLVKALHDARADASRRDELLDAGIAHAHQGEFRCCEEGIGCHQEKDQKDPEQHKGDHGWVILTFQRQVDRYSGIARARGCPFEHGSTADRATSGIGLRPRTGAAYRICPGHKIPF